MGTGLKATLLSAAPFSLRPIGSATEPAAPLLPPAVPITTDGAQPHVLIDEVTGLEVRFVVAASRVEELLSVLEAAETVEEMNIPGYRLHSLTGNLHGYWSVRVTGNWRIVFRFENGEALDVDLDDYH